MHTFFEHIKPEKNEQEVPLLEIRIENKADEDLPNKPDLYQIIEKNNTNCEEHPSEKKKIEYSTEKFLYERIKEAIDILQDAQKTAQELIKNHSDSKSRLNSLFGFKIISWLASSPSVYGLLTSLDRIVSKDVFSKLLTLNDKLLAQTNKLNTIIQTFQQERNYLGETMVNLAQNYLSHLTYFCQSDVLWQSYYSGAPYCNSIYDYYDHLNCIIKEMCGYIAEHGINLEDFDCEHTKERMCFWFKQSEVVDSLNLSISQLQEEITNTTHSRAIPDDYIQGAAIASAILSFLVFIYYGKTFYQAHSQYKVDIKLSSQIGSCLKDPVKINFIINVCEQLKIPCANRPVEEIIEKLRGQLEIVSNKRRCRNHFFYFCEEKQVPKDIFKKILCDTDLVVGGQAVQAHIKR